VGEAGAEKPAAAQDQLPPVFLLPAGTKNELAKYFFCGIAGSNQVGRCNSTKKSHFAQLVARRRVFRYVGAVGSVLPGGVGLLFRPCAVGEAKKRVLL